MCLAHVPCLLVNPIYVCQCYYLKRPLVHFFMNNKITLSTYKLILLWIKCTNYHWLSAFLASQKVENTVRFNERFVCLLTHKIGIQSLAKYTREIKYINDIFVCVNTVYISSLKWTTQMFFSCPCWWNIISFLTLHCSTCSALNLSLCHF